MVACGNENNNSNNNQSNNENNEDYYSTKIEDGLYLKDTPELPYILNPGTRYVKDYDEVEDAYVYSANRTWGVDENTSGGIYPTIITKGEEKTTYIKYVYTGYDWVFFDKIIIRTDGNRYEQQFDYNEVKRDTSSLGGQHVEEKVTRDIDKETYDILKDIAESSRTILRFSGQDGSVDREMTKENIAQVRKYVECFAED